MYVEYNIIYLTHINSFKFSVNKKIISLRKLTQTQFFKCFI